MKNSYSCIREWHARVREWENVALGFDITVFFGDGILVFIDLEPLKRVVIIASPKPKVLQFKFDKQTVFVSFDLQCGIKKESFIVLELN